MLWSHVQLYKDCETLAGEVDGKKRRMEEMREQVVQANEQLKEVRSWRSPALDDCLLTPGRVTKRRRKSSKVCLMKASRCGWGTLAVTTRTVGRSLDPGANHDFYRSSTSTRTRATSPSLSDISFRSYFLVSLKICQTRLVTTRVEFDRFL